MSLARLLVTGLLLAPGVLGCSSATSDAEPRPSGAPVSAFVAASTTDAVQEIARLFKELKAGAVTINADDSSKLALQIAAGAPADLFLAANEHWSDFVKEQGFAQESTLLLGNSLVLVVPADNPAGVREPADLGNAGVERIAVAGPAVPAGIYAREALANLGLWQKLGARKKLVGGANVRVTLSQIERGEAEGGIVYATDARISDKVKAVYTFDPSTHQPIRYPLLLLKDSRRHPAAQDFYKFLQGQEARMIFQKHGFTVLDR